MKISPLLFCLAALLSNPVRAADTAPADVPPEPGEPAVQHIVIEGKETRIEELRVRGQSQRITVKNKGPLKGSYEIVPADTGRDISTDPSGNRGSAGQRVWSVLSF